MAQVSFLASSVDVNVIEDFLDDNDITWDDLCSALSLFISELFPC